MNVIKIIENKITEQKNVLEHYELQEDEQINDNNLQCGMELINGEWVIPKPQPPQPSEVDILKEKLKTAEQAISETTATVQQLLEALIDLEVI